MKKCILTVLAFTALALPLHAQEIEKLSWMTGSWTQSKDGETVQESWLGPRGNMMVGVSLTSSPKRGTTFEFLRIIDASSGLTFLASPGGKPPVEFKLKVLGEKRVVFENLANDFPHRVMYWMEPDGAMNARIEGTMQGKARGIEWRFLLAK